MTGTATDRRRHPRIDLTKGCKIYHRASLRYLFGETRNVSRTGAMVTIDRARSLRPGDDLELAIAWDNSPVVARSRLTRASVVRVLSSTDGRQAVAISFENEMALADAA